MSRSEASESQLKLRSVSARILPICLLAALFSLPASAQDFSLTANPFDPQAVAPGGTSSSSIQIVTNPGFVGPVTFACTVTPPVSIPPADVPVCTISPSTLSGSGGASATITTTGATSTLGYTVTISGTDSSGTQTSPPLGVTVLAVTPQFTLTVQSAIAPSSVVAGNGAEATVTINPLDGYTTPVPGGYITLYCSSMTPLVTIPPICSFSPNSKDLTVSGNTPVSSTLTISTFGPVITSETAHPRLFYALWLPFSVLGFVFVAAGGKRAKKACGLLALFMMCGAFLLLPACSNNTTTTSTPNGITPANTYSFTIVGVDSNGVVSSNTGSTTSVGPSVSLTVTAPAK
jgi:hypothetical protein